MSPTASDEVRLRRVAVALDGSESAWSALRLAIDIASAHGSRLLLMAVVPVAPAFSAHETAASALVGALREDARESLREARSRVDAAGLHSDETLAEGYAAEEIVSILEREGPDLAILGHRGLSAQRMHLVGSVGYNVAQFSPVPVLIARSDAFPRRILLPYDGSEAASRAASWARTLATGPEASVTVLFVVPERPEETKFTVTRGVSEPFLGPLVDELTRAGIRVRRQVEYGHPAERIVNAAREGRSDLVVMGRVGRSGPAGFAVGGVTDKILHYAPTSTLVVP
ncbi:MAG: universal stress protein [Candidatus Thermoplasmatota archaeon]